MTTIRRKYYESFPRAKKSRATALTKTLTHGMIILRANGILREMLSTFFNISKIFIEKKVSVLIHIEIMIKIIYYIKKIAI